LFREPPPFVPFLPLPLTLPTKTRNSALSCAELRPYFRDFPFIILPNPSYDPLFCDVSKLVSPTPLPIVTQFFPSFLSLAHYLAAGIGPAIEAFRELSANKVPRPWEFPPFFYPHIPSLGVLGLISNRYCPPSRILSEPGSPPPPSTSTSPPSSYYLHPPSWQKPRERKALSGRSARL